MNRSISLNRMIKKAAKKVVEDDIKFLNETKEEDLKFSRSFTKDINELFEESSAPNPKPKRLKILSRASVAALAAMLAFVFLFSEIYPAIVAFNRSGIKYPQQTSSIWQPSGISMFLKPAVKIFKRKNPEYIPSGLELTKKVYKKYRYDKRYELTYEDENGGKYFKFIQVFKGFGSPDIDGYTEKSKLKIGKYEANVASKTENGIKTICIYWDDSTYHYEIYSNLPLDEVTEIAKNIK